MPKNDDKPHAYLGRDDQAQRDKLHALQDAITAGLESGEPRAFDLKAFRRRMALTAPSSRF